MLGGRAATLSKGSEFFGVGFQPAVLERGQGARVIAPDGTSLLDWISGLGALILGHPDPSIILPNDGEPAANKWAEAVCRQAWYSAAFSLPHRLEASVAEKLAALLQAHVPGWQAQPLGVRWLKTGSDACAAAVRLARAVTGRKWIISIGYHGYHDWAVSTTPPAWGVVQPQAVEAIPFGELGMLGQSLAMAGLHAWEHSSSAAVAAVIVEQPPQDTPAGYWRVLRELCDKYSALLIADEVVTGLRYGLGGACQRFGIQPDIVCMGKALGNGLPIAAIVGRRDYWDWFSRNDPCFISSTSFGEAVSLAAADAVLDCWGEDQVNHLWTVGAALIEGLQAAGYKVAGYPPHSLLLHESPSHRAYFIREMARRGVLLNRPNFPTLAHTLEDVTATVQAAVDVKYAMERLGPDGLAREMAGRLPAVLFSNR